jgi:hypothetical protein
MCLPSIEKHASAIYRNKTGRTVVSRFFSEDTAGGVALSAATWTWHAARDVALPRGCRALFLFPKDNPTYADMNGLPVRG